jgi:hypothetical protein
MARIWSGQVDSADSEHPNATKAEDFSHMMMSFLTDGVHHFGECLRVKTGSGLSVNIQGGERHYAHIKGHYFGIIPDLDGDLKNLPIPAANPTLPRVDRVILRMSLNPLPDEYGIFPIILQGIPAASPTAPELVRNGSIYDISLARYTLPAGAISASSVTIVDERTNTTLCGQVNSLLGLDPSVWQSQFDAFMASLLTTGNAKTQQLQTAFDALTAALQVQSTQMISNNQSDFNAFFTNVQTDISDFLSFDYDNFAFFLGCKKTVSEDANGTITESARRVSNNTLFATRVTSFPPNGNVEAIISRYAPNGSTIIQQYTATASENGTVIEVII